MITKKQFLDYYNSIVDPNDHLDWNVVWAAVKYFIDPLQAELDKHNQQGGIVMKCGHPIQCAYSQAKIDGGPGCSMCDLEKKNKKLNESVNTLIRDILDKCKNCFYRKWMKEYTNCD